MTSPTIFTVETVLGCNLHCLECAVGSNLVQRPYGQMTFTQFQVIYEKIKNYATLMYLHLWGEPLLNKDILPIIKLASQTSRTNISTNANMLTQDMADALVEAGTSEFIVSLDGVTQKTYGIYRRGGNAEKAYQGLFHLVASREKFGRDVTISPQFVVFDHNKHEMDAFFEICKQMGLLPCFKAPYLRKNSYLSNSGIKQFMRNIQHDADKKKEAIKNCTLENEFTILLDGSVVACCYDHNGETTFGNIFEQSVEEIISSEKYKKFCKRIKEGDAPDFCMQGCLCF